ncbi:ATP-dependent helicase [Rhodobacteraceae bacterium RKSG542]|uniref:UvrD-helicase domain-containing protein n=1 Tax=Pseudovibrio flavus TaxID=2529854 RepID=UPI0012BC250C|nr:ATP-dependent helicase [Pseudovibrio flavus]MTI18571.1 ATP-dependent helicase [Pseudovibrio flavus]
MSRWIDPSAWAPQAGIALDEQTRVAVVTNENAAIMAGPGAGKTELLAQRAAFLMQTNTCAQPKRILAISFKRDAAKNLRDRVEQRVGSDLARRFESYTFDAFAKSLLDRFRDALPEWCRPTRDYQLQFPNWRDWAQFADQIARPQEFRTEAITGIQIQNRHAFWGGVISGLPLERPEPVQLLDHAYLQWWDASIGQDRSRLTFQMITALALTILTHNPLILRALRQTYSNVFVDEFQDTTGPQYEFLKRLFRESPSVVTAVGDNKQLIMTFAGANAGRFEQFTADFSANIRPLSTNFRSNTRIVEIINSMAQAIEPAAILTNAARQHQELPALTDGIFHFNDSAEQANELASSIAADVNAVGGQLKQHDFMLLVRQYADTAEEELSDRFAAEGLSVRNEARVIAGVTIQDMMSEPLADLVVGILQLACEDREDNPFQRVTNLIGTAFGIEDDRPASIHRIEKTLRQTVSSASVRTSAVQRPSNDFDFNALVVGIVEALGESKVRRLSSNYEDFERYSEVRNAIAEYLSECSTEAQNWRDVISSFLGKDQVRLMTIHKCKGLEAHTVFFLNLQDDSFHRRANMDEERLTFFVAASRAKERFFVTTTGRERRKVAPLFDMITAAQLPTLRELEPRNPLLPPN